MNQKKILMLYLTVNIQMRSIRINKILIRLEILFNKQEKIFIYSLSNEN